MISNLFHFPFFVFFFFFPSWTNSFTSFQRMSHRDRTSSWLPLRPFVPVITATTTTTVAATTKTSMDETTTTKTASSLTSQDDSTRILGSVTFWIPSHADTMVSQFGSKSPVGNPTLQDAISHLAQKINWMAQNRLHVSIVNGIPTTTTTTNEQDLMNTDVLLAIGFPTTTNMDEKNDEMQYVESVFQKRYQQRQNRQCQLVLDGTEEKNGSNTASTAINLPIFVGPYDPQNPSWMAQYIPWSIDATGKRLYERMTNVFTRWTTDDVCYGILLFFNQFSGQTIDWVQHTTEATWEKGIVQNIQELSGIVTKCPDCLVNCIQEPSCRECIQVLGTIDARDQVASYRTIVSYESEALKQFSLCIMTKHNIFNCSATIPTLPDGMVQPITTWRNRTLSVEDGKAILVGHLNDPSAPDGGYQTNVSWIVACGANVAYDQFPCQNQLFYPQGTQTMWYDPVFRVQTLDGRDVWCSRHYRVRPQTQRPGTFRLSVLDNGVTSDEYWTIVGVADNLSWVCFHYAGAASAVGLQYIGGLLCTPDGKLPTNEQDRNDAFRCLQKAGIQPWELVVVDNDPNSPGAKAAGPPPLDLYRSKSQQIQFSSEK